MRNLWSYSHFTGSGNGSGDRAWYRSQSMVRVPDFTGGSGTGAKFSSGRVLGETLSLFSVSLNKEQFLNTLLQVMKMRFILTEI